MCLFTGFTIQAEQREMIGTSVIAHVCILILIHTTLWLLGIIRSLKSRYTRHRNHQLSKKPAYRVKKALKSKLNQVSLDTADRRSPVSTARELLKDVKLESINEDDRDLEISIVNSEGLNSKIAAESRKQTNLYSLSIPSNDEEIEEVK